jgi:hypothetical protein
MEKTIDLCTSYIRKLLMKFCVLILTVLLFHACGSAGLVVNANKEIDYSNFDYWAALPQKQDPSDLSPDGLKPEADGGVDIFFLYPTSLLAKKDRHLHNAPIDYKKINEYTDKTSIKYQASIFNQVGKVYAPRYRQAHYHEDVRHAFQYYLDHFNQGRPIIIAGHSQGTTHGMRLLKEYFDGKPLQEKLVVAYLPGIPIPQDLYSNIRICDNATDLTCVNSWRSYKYGHAPGFLEKENPTVIVNPITWSRDTSITDKSKNKGAVLRKFENGVLKGIADAQIHKNILWIHKPKFPGSLLYWSKNYHVADFNFFYMDVRENAKLRRDVFLKR